MYSRYASSNAKMSSSMADTMSEMVPAYMKDRPNFFIRHCMRALNESRSWTSAMVEEVDVYLFKV